jgi:uncharacterized protein (DUF362 family)
MIDRRQFIIGIAGGLLTAVTGDKAMAAVRKNLRTKVALVNTSHRETGIKKAIDLLGINPVSGKHVLLKPNFNTADSYPGSTHNDTLEQLILHLKGMGAKGITIGERSGPPDTADVLSEKGIYDLCRKHDVGIINFEDIPSDKWVKVKPKQSHWINGFLVAQPVIDSECTVATCCLKTHGYGGVFTMSLKLSVGVTHKKNMAELHSSFINMRRMIAEINQAYAPSLILMDGIEAFTDGGPAHGTKKGANVILAGTDRIAIDAVGLAVLKKLGSNKNIMKRKIFQQEQIARAVEIGLGISGPEGIEIVADDEDSRKYAGELREILKEG